MLEKHSFVKSQFNVFSCKSVGHACVIALDPTTRRTRQVQNRPHVLKFIEAIRK